MDKSTSKNYIAIGLLIGVIALTILQILNADTTTKTESALFNILQFIFSVGFSWIISSYFSELSFLESQKKFAIGAFRRIKEIERSIGRAQHLLTSEKSISDGKQESNHNAVMMSLLSAQDAVNSSVADWGDIIGDEIHLTKEIDRLKGLRKSADKFEREYLDNLRVRNKSDEEILKEISELKAELPASLKVEDDEDDSYQYELAESLLRSEIENTGRIELRGFWEKDDSFKGDLSNIKPGDTLYISRGFTESRPNVMLAFDESDNWVGIITNKFIQEDDEIHMDYDSFLDFFEHCIDYKLTPKHFGGTPLPIKMAEIDDINEAGYQHFRAYLSASDLPNK
ncbi:hypothetical protein [Microbulbifer sp. TRSA005]|uniref:hypothetical protein n=1 Tax=Microbulbifer sp. TRSA005 TaxID=3243383 RepID=UPI00403932C5